MDNYLVKIEQNELTMNDAIAIKKQTGYMITVPEQFEQFKNVANAIVKLKNNPDYMSVIKVNSIKEIIESDSLLTILNVHKFAGLAYIQAVLTLAITNLCKMFNINKNMSGEQIQFLVNEMINTYPLNNLCLADVKLCFKWIIAGRYGKIYDRLDPNIILDALNSYWDNRSELADDIEYSRHQSRKADAIDREDKTQLRGQSREDIIKIMRKNNSL